MTAGAWRHGWRIVRAQPLTFVVYLAHYLVFYTLPVASGLLLRGVFDALNRHAPAGLNVWSLIALIAGAELGRLVAIVSTVRFGAAFHLGLAARMRGAMLSWMVAGPGGGRVAVSPGEAVSRFRDDVAGMDDFMEAWIDLSGEMLLCLAALAIMFSIDAEITAVVVLPLVAIVTLTDRLTARIQRVRAASREAGARVAAFIAEAFGAVQTVRVASAEPRIVAHLDRLNEARRRAAMRDGLLASAHDGLGANIAAVGAGLVLLLAAGAMHRGAFTVGDFALFASYISLAGGGPRWLGRILARRRQADVSIRRMDGLMPGAGPLALTGAPTPAATVRPAAAFERLAVHGLCYRYPGGAGGIADVDVQVRRGDLTVVTGPVGAGKTTLLRCLFGLLPIDAGEIRWNGQIVEDPSTFMTPPRCALVPQAARLFSETLRQNIMMGRPATDAEVALAIERAILTEDLAQLSEGLETPVGARGATLSGGQVQRAATARALLTGAQLLVLDDLASALDVDTEQQLWARLADAPGLTCLAVSHRREAFRRASEIIVMDGGRVVARGQCQALLTASGLFAGLWGDAR